MLAAERAAGLDRLDTYRSFGAAVRTTRRMLRDFLTGAKLAGRSVVGYGAPAKGNTLLNYCGVGTDLIAYTVDRSPHKQGNFLPGTHMPIHHPDHIRETKPDFVLILPWNLQARDHGADGLHPRLGRPVRRADSPGPRLRLTADRCAFARPPCPAPG